MRGRNSDNTMIKARLGWAPSISIKVGLKNTHAWIKSQIEAEVQAGTAANQYATSEVSTRIALHTSPSPSA